MRCGTPRNSETRSLAFLRRRGGGSFPRPGEWSAGAWCNWCTPSSPTRLRRPRSVRARRPNPRPFGDLGCHQYRSRTVDYTHRLDSIPGASTTYLLDTARLSGGIRTWADDVTLSNSVRWVRLTLVNRSMSEVTIDWAKSAWIDAAGERHAISRAKAFSHGPDNWLADEILPDEPTVMAPGAQVVEHVCPRDSTDQRKWYYVAWWGALLNIETSARCYSCRSWIREATSEPQGISLEVSLHVRGEDIAVSRRFSLEVQAVWDTRTGSPSFLRMQ